MTANDYYKITSDIALARQNQDWNLVKKLEKKLTKWQNWYGAMAPAK